MTQQDEILAMFENKYGKRKVKKINTDNYVDMYFPEINSDEKTHLFINTTSNKIRIGFWGKDAVWATDLVSRFPEKLEIFSSKSIRPFNNPAFESIQEAWTLIEDFVRVLSNKSELNAHVVNTDVIKPVNVNLKYANWNLKNENVIVLAGSTGLEQALRYNIYTCQNLRSFRSAKYLTFYKDGQINQLFEITDSPYDYGTCDNTPEYQKMVEDKFIENVGDLRVFRLKNLGSIGPVKNDSVSKTGKPVPFTYGQPRYTTLDRIKNAKLTSELITGLTEEALVLDSVGSNTMINPNNATIKLSWKSTDDFDIAVAYQDKNGKKGLVFFSDKGSISNFPYMLLDKDSMGINSDEAETILINNLDEMEKIYILCWDWQAYIGGRRANFDNAQVKVAIEDENYFSSVAVLKTEGKFNSTCIAQIKNTREGFSFINISKGFNLNVADAESIFSEIEQ